MASRRAQPSSTGETKRVTFGSPTTLSAKVARERAGRLHAEVKLGTDPQSDKEEGRRWS
jgi:hypothetical protein